MAKDRSHPFSMRKDNQNAQSFECMEAMTVLGRRKIRNKKQSGIKEYLIKKTPTNLVLGVKQSW